MIKLFLGGYNFFKLILTLQKIKFCKFYDVLFFSIKILHSLLNRQNYQWKFDLLEKFTITYKQGRKNISLKECKTNNKIQKDKNIEKVQDRR
jgi:hypothetical protein